MGHKINCDMKTDKNAVKEYEIVEYLEGLNLKVFVSCIVSHNHSKFHWHREIELLYILDGPVVVYTENAQYQLETNDIFIINSNEAHCIQKTSNVNSILIFQITADFCHSYYPDLKNLMFIDRHFSSSNDNTKKIWRSLYNYIVDIMFILAKKNKTAFQLKIMGIINNIFFQLLSNSKYEIISNEKTVIDTRNIKRLNRIIAYMQENYMYKISLSDLAENENLDMYYLSHFIKKHLGLSFQKYLNKLRLAKAIQLLISTDNRTIDICIESGFSDYRYLCKAFAEEYGCTPSQYKVKHPEKQQEYLSNCQNDSQQYILMDLQNTFEIFFDYLKNTDERKIINYDF